MLSQLNALKKFAARYGLASDMKLGVAGPTFLPFNAANYSSRHALRRLYEHSRQEGNVVEGQLAPKAILDFISDIEIKHRIDRISAAAMERRLSAIAAWSQRAFNEIVGLDAVVLYGSALRGKRDPSDVDICFVTAFEPPELYDPQSNERRKTLSGCERIMGDFVRAALPKEILGIPVKAHALAWFDEHPYLRLKFVARNPFLVLAKTKLENEIQIFFNPSGDEYLESKKP